MIEFSSLGFHNVFSSKELLVLEQKCLSKQILKGSFLYQPGDQIDSIYIVQKGKFLSYRITSCGKPCVVRTLTKGDFIGEEDILSYSIRDSFVESITTSQYIMIPRKYYEDLLCNNQEFARARLEQLSKRMKETEQMMSVIAYSSVSKRLMLLLTEIGKQTGINDLHEITFHLDMSHQDLASMIGSTRETVTSNISSLQREGLLKVNGKQICIRKNKLEKYL